MDLRKMIKNWGEIILTFRGNSPPVRRPGVGKRGELSLGETGKPAIEITSHIENFFACTSRQPAGDGKKKSNQ